MRPLFCAALLAGLLTASSSAEAKTFNFDQLDIRCVVPDGWTFNSRTNFLIDVFDATGQKHFILWATHTVPSDDLNDPRCRERVEQSFIAHGFNVVKRQMLSLHGVPFYKVCLTKDLGNKTLNASAYVAVTSQYDYGINISEYNADPDNDSDLGKIVGSVAFLRPPTLLSSNPLVRLFTPRDGLAHTPAFLLGYRTVIVILLILMISIPSGILAGIGLGIYFLVRSKPSPGPRVPPSAT